MSTIKSNPFSELEIVVNQKAIFQPFSNEAKSFNNKKSLDLLIFLVLQGFDLHKIVLEYLDSKVSLNDRSRISEIESAFKIYHYKLEPDFDWRIKQCTKSKLNMLKINYAKILTENENIDLKKEGDLADFYTRMSEQIEGFVKAAKSSAVSPDSISLRRLIIAFVDDDRRSYIYLSKLLHIDLEKDLTEEILEREKDNNNTHWNQKSLYSLVKNTFLNFIKKNQIPTDLTPVYDCPSTQYYNTLLKKFYPIEEHQKIKSDENFRRERMLDYAEKVIEILWLNKSFFDEPIFLIRTNYKEPLEAKEMIPFLFENNITSICIQDKEEDHLSYYENLIAGKNVKFDIGKNYIKYFVDIANISKTKDVLIVAMYEGFETKIGLIKKGEQIFTQVQKGFTLFCLQMKSVYCTPSPNFWGNEIKSLNLSHYPVLKSLIPQQVTISPIQKNKNIIYSIYYGCPIKLELASMSNETIETMCAEWLRSEYAPKEFKIHFQLIRTGGNFADIDILGCNANNEIIACQVTNTNNVKLINDKAQKLDSFFSDKKIMFSQLKTYWKTQDNYNQNINEVWNNLKNDRIYTKLLERLIYGLI